MIFKARSSQEEVSHLLILERAKIQRGKSSKPERRKRNLIVMQILKADTRLMARQQQGELPI